jgi:hypothetical protein
LVRPEGRLRPTARQVRGPGDLVRDTDTPPRQLCSDDRVEHGGRAQRADARVPENARQVGGVGARRGIEEEHGAAIEAKAHGSGISKARASSDPSFSRRLELSATAASRGLARSRLGHDRSVDLLWLSVSRGTRRTPLTGERHGDRSRPNGHEL